MRHYLIAFLFMAAVVYFFGSLPKVVPPNQLTLRVLDIGQGDSLYLRLPTGEDILIDAGPNDKVLSQLGRYMPINDRVIELAIISHNHADHIGGFKAVLERYTINRLWITGAIHTTDQYLSLLSLIGEKAMPTTTVKAGDMNRIQQVELIILHPPVEMVGHQPEDQHDATIALKLQYQTFCALLTGDLNTRHEADLLAVTQSLKQSLSCPVLKVTHHGSAHGTGKELLAAVKPKVAIISAGAENRYGHPAPSLLRRLREAKATIYRTDQQGTITVTSDGRSFWTKTER